MLCFCGTQPEELPSANMRTTEPPSSCRELLGGIWTKRVGVCCCPELHRDQRWRRPRWKSGRRLRGLCGRARWQSRAADLSAPSLLVVSLLLAAIGLDMAHRVAIEALLALARIGRVTVPRASVRAALALSRTRVVLALGATAPPLSSPPFAWRWPKSNDWGSWARVRATASISSHIFASVSRRAECKAR